MAAGFTKRHYDMVATLLNTQIRPKLVNGEDDMRGNLHFDIVVAEFARMFHADNSNFKPALFILRAKHDDTKIKI